MDYDKSSFLAGLSAGRTLKGWACAQGGIPAGKGNDIVFGFGMTISPLSFPGVVMTAADGLIYGEYVKEE